MRRFRVIKRVILFLVVMVLLFVAIVCGAVGLLFTPQFITPYIVDFAQQYTKSEVSIASVDLSLFQRFPNITLRIDSLRVTQTKDSIDDLLFARQCRVAIDPMELIKNKKVMVNHLSLRGGSVYLYVDSLHRPINTFILPETQEQVDTLNQVDISEYTFALRRMKIDSMRLVVDDRLKRFYTRVENYGADMSMSVDSRRGKFDVATSFSNLIVWRDGDLLVKRTSMYFRSQLLYDRDSMRIDFTGAQMHINGIDLMANGVLRRDTINRGILVDVNTSLKSSSLAEFLALIPESVVDEKDKITTEGEVLFDMRLEGLYSDESMPTIAAEIKMVDAKAKYESRRLALESVNCDAFAFVDMNNPERSYADIRGLQVNTSDIIDVDFNGRVNNIILDPDFDLRVRSKLDLDRFTEVFPLKDGIVCSGIAESDLDVQFLLSDVEKSNYAKLYIDGETLFHNLDLTYDASKFVQDTSSVAYFHMRAKEGLMSFGDNIVAETDSRTLRSKVNFSGLNYRSKSGESIVIRDIELTAGANFDRGSSTMRGVGVRGVAKNMEVALDTLFHAALESSDVTLIVSPKREDKQASVQAKINSRHIVASEPAYNSTVELSSVDLAVTMDKLEQKSKEGLAWSMNGVVSFVDMAMRTDLFSLDVAIPETTVSVADRTIKLTNAALKVGESDLVATGYVSNLLTKMFVNPQLPLSGELSIRSKMMDFNALIDASNKSVLMLDELSDATDATESADASESTEEVEQVVVDSLAAPKLFLVPRKMDFVFDMAIEKALVGDAVVENLGGRATMRRGKLTIEDLKLNAIGAEATGALIYRNLNRDSANLAANIHLSDVDINRIGELLPSVTTVLPMLSSFEGIVDFELIIKSDLDRDSNPVVPTLSSAMALKGRDLVLMDSETFADLSKTLMFKNKDRNLIEALEVFALVDESKVDILPFALSIDRYSTIIGGTQTIDPVSFGVDYEYHISVIKSPLPFKAGVDVWGNLEDFKFKVSKAKLKKTDFDEQRTIYEQYCAGIDQSSEELERTIAERHKKMQEQHRARMEKEREKEREESEEESEEDEEQEQAQ